MTVSTVGTLLGFGFLIVVLFYGWVGALVSVVALVPLLFLPAFAGSLERISDEEVGRRRSLALVLLGLLTLAVVVAGVVESF